MDAPEIEPPRFLCDAMLGSLCRWLRFAGFDSEFAGVEAADAEIGHRAEIEGRWLLTMDRRLGAVGPRSMLVRSKGMEHQMAEVLFRLNLRPDTTLRGARCSRCNGILVIPDSSEISALAPPYVLKTVQRFRRCRDCGRLYWPGTHSEKIRARLERISRIIENREVQENPGGI